MNQEKFSITPASAQTKLTLEVAPEGLQTAPAILPELAAAVTRLSPREQATVNQIVRYYDVTTRDTPIHSAMALIHQFLKADPDPKNSDAPSYKEITTMKAPPMVKTFTGLPRVALPRPDTRLVAPLGDVLFDRSSSHHFAPNPLELETLGSFLWHTCGVKRVTAAYNVPRFPIRVAPSAGGLQPIDVYVVVNQVDDVAKGLYYYDPSSHELVMLDRGNMRFLLTDCTAHQNWIAYAPVVFALAINASRFVWKYGTRGYRFAHADLGVLAQTMYLVGTALNLSTCAVAAFFDDKLNAFLGLDGHTEFASLLFTIGHKPLMDG